jgi:signal transduction histidine kinase
LADPASTTSRCDIKASRSLFANRCPSSRIGSQRRSAASPRLQAWPGRAQLRIVERVIDVGDVGIYLVQVAGSGGEMEEQIARFRFALIVAFAALAIALAIGAAFQVRFGLRPLGQLQRELASIRGGERRRIMDAYPSRIAPLAEELNLLISANRDILRTRAHAGRQSRPCAENAALRHRQ